jgi:hypothetical protein
MADTIPTLDAARHEIARDATYEAQVLALTLRKLIEQHDTGAEIAAAARGILTRISDLSDIVYEAVVNDDNDREDIRSLQRKLGLSALRR